MHEWSYSRHYLATRSASPPANVGVTTATLRRPSCPYHSPAATRRHRSHRNALEHQLRHCRLVARRRRAQTTSATSTTTSGRGAAPESRGRRWSARGRTPTSGWWSSAGARTWRRTTARTRPGTCSRSGSSCSSSAATPAASRTWTSCSPATTPARCAPPTSRRPSQAPPVFRYCKDASTLDIVFPDWSFWGWPEVGIRPWTQMLEEVARENERVRWPERQPYAYWKGAPSRYRIRHELMRCNASNGQEWNARLFSQVLQEKLPFLFFFFFTESESAG